MEIQNSKVKSQRLLLIIALVGFFLFPANQVLATCTNPPAGIIPCGNATCPCTFCDIFQLINNIINFFLVPCAVNHRIAVVPIIATLMFAGGGLYMLVSGASPEKVKKARDVLTAVVVGLVIVYASWAFLNTLFTAMKVASWGGLGTWWKIQCQ